MGEDRVFGHDEVRRVPHVCPRCGLRVIDVTRRLCPKCNVKMQPEPTP